jgi:hypothetical protein
MSIKVPCGVLLGVNSLAFFLAPSVGIHFHWGYLIIFTVTVVAFLVAEHGGYLW